MTDQPARARIDRVVIGLVAGLIVGAILGATAERDVTDRVVDAIAPLGALWINSVRMTVVPLVVALLFVSVVDAGREGGAGLGREGRATLLAFLGLLAMAALYALVVVPPVMRDMPLDASAADALRASVAARAADVTEQVKTTPSFAQWVTSLVPTNVIKAAADTAMLPLVLFVLLFALAARRIDPARRDALAGFFRAVGDAMTTIVRWVIALAPIGVFALILGPASRGSASLAGAIGYYVVAISLVLLLFTLLLYAVARMAGMPIRLFARGVFPSQAVAFASSSSLASLPALIDGSRRAGIAEPIAGFVLPLAVGTFKIATPITWMVGSMFLGRAYGVELSATGLLTVSAMAIVSGFSTPGIPNGAFLLMAPVLAALSIPPEGIALLIAADTIPDLFGTVANVTGDMTAAVIVHRSTAPDTVDADEESGPADHQAAQ